MIIERIHQEIKNRWNKLNSNQKPDFSPAYLDDCINKAQEDYVDIFYSGNNSKQYRFGFEVTQQRIDMLQGLVALYNGNITNNNNGLFSTPLESISLYRYFVKGSVLVAGCTERVPLTIVRLNDFDHIMKDINRRPSKKWNIALATIKANRIFYHVDGIPTNVNIDYVIDPPKVFSGGYDSLEFLFGDTAAYKAADPKVTSSIDNSFHDMLTDMTVQYIARIFEDQTKYSLQERDIINKT